MSQGLSGMGAYGGELFPSYSAVEARREWEIEMIKEKLARNEKVDTAVCRVERVRATSSTVRYGLKRGKLLYLFKYPSHDVEREKHRNVITRARFIKNALEAEGYRLIPWDFKKGQPPTFWEEQEKETSAARTMEEEDDDLYGPSEPKVEDKSEVKGESGSEGGDEPMDEGLESGEEEESDSDSDLEIIIDKPKTAVPAAKPSAPQESKAIKIEAPPPQPSTSTKPIPHHPSVPQLSSIPGTSYPAVRTSSIDVNANPIYPPTGKTVTAIDIDADLAESTKPWRLPGADQSDYFNYGFDEFTWEMYRQRQQQMAAGLEMQKNEVTQFQQMFMGGMGAPPGAGGAPAGAQGGGGGGAGAGNAGGVPGAPTGPSGQGGGGGAAAAAGGMGGMPGMPGMNEEQMMQMMAQMSAQGMDIGNMDFQSFFQMASGGMPGFGGQGQGQGQQGYGGGGGGGGGGGQQGGRGGGRRGRGW